MGGKAAATTRKGRSTTAVSGSTRSRKAKESVSSSASIPETDSASDWVFLASRYDCTELYIIASNPTNDGVIAWLHTQLSANPDEELQWRWEKRSDTPASIAAERAAKQAAIRRANGLYREPATLTPVTVGNGIERWPESEVHERLKQRYWIPRGGTCNRSGTVSVCWVRDQLDQETLAKEEFPSLMLLALTKFKGAEPNVTAQVQPDADASPSNPATEESVGPGSASASTSSSNGNANSNSSSDAHVAAPDSGSGRGRGKGGRGRKRTAVAATITVPADSDEDGSATVPASSNVATQAEGGSHTRSTRAKRARSAKNPRRQ